ncbi:hypothetical protein BLOT_014358, partial [Blomia tropicalis]
IEITFSFWPMDWSILGNNQRNRQEPKLNKITKQEKKGRLNNNNSQEMNEKGNECDKSTRRQRVLNFGNFKLGKTLKMNERTNEQRNSSNTNERNAKASKAN